MPDVMPTSISPMLAKLSSVLPSDDDRWAFEMKWDGIRAIALIRNRDLRILTRNQIDVTRRYPEMNGLAAQLDGRSVILDGEIVGFDAGGRSSFEALQQRMGLDGGKHVPSRPDVPVAYMIFDLLHSENESLLAATYEDRRERLESLHLEDGSWMTPPSAIGDGPGMLAISREQQFEGVIAKRLGSKYELGKRSGAWLKIKNHLRQEFVVGGWVPGEGRRRGQIGSLIIGYFADGQLISAGSVGTGFTDRMLVDLGEQLAPPGACRQPVRDW